MLQMIVTSAAGTNRYLFKSRDEALENIDVILEDENEDRNLTIELRRMELVRGSKSDAKRLE